MTYEEIAAGIKYYDRVIDDLNSEICATCINYNLESGRCRWLDTESSINFICDGYRRKRSGQYRRKRAKYNKR